MLSRSILTASRSVMCKSVPSVCNFSQHTDGIDDSLTHKTQMGGFAKAFEKFSALQNSEEPLKLEKEPAKSFLTLLRQSKLMQVSLMIIYFIIFCYETILMLYCIIVIWKSSYD